MDTALTLYPTAPVSASAGPHLGNLAHASVQANAVACSFLTTRGLGPRPPRLIFRDLLAIGAS